MLIPGKGKREKFLSVKSLPFFDKKYKGKSYNCTGANWFLPELHSGHIQSYGRDKKFSPGGIPPTGSPTSGS